MKYDTFEGTQERIQKRVKTVRKRNRLRDRLIVQKTIEGKTAKEISEECTKELGKPVSSAVVAQVRNRDDIQGMLDREYCKLASALPKATDNIINATNNFSSGQTSEDKKISWEASKLVAQAHGLLPTSNQSVIHQTYINQQNNTVIPPVIAELAAKHFGGFANIPIEMERADARQLQENEE